MNDQELREMVRASIARQRAGAGDVMRPAMGQPHPAFLRLPLVAGGDADGNCVIEPAVRCNHCGYCQSYGH